jgi:hypothetical protein
VRSPRPLVILAIGFALFAVYAFPGIMSLDGCAQLAQARKHVYADDHPPAMAAIWSVTDRIIAGPFPLLVLAGTSFLAGAYRWLRRALSPHAAAYTAVGLLLLPPVLTTMAVIWKDSLMAGWLLLGSSLLFDDRRRVQAAGLALIALATAIKYNAPSATLSLVVLILARPGALARHALARYAIAFAAWLVVTAAVFRVNDALADRRMHVWNATLAAMDIVGTLEYVTPDLPDDQLRAILDGTPLLIKDHIHAYARKMYRPANYWQLVDGGEPMFGAWESIDLTPAQRDAMTHAWWTIVSTYPLAYAEHRLTTFAEVIGFTAEHHPLWGAVPTSARQPEECLRDHDLGRYAWPVQDAWQRAMWWFQRETILFRPWAYLLLALALLALCRGQRDVFALVTSGLLSMVGLVFVAPTPDFRYSHWMVVATILATILVVVRRYRAGRAARTR